MVTEIPVIWFQAAACTGCAVSVLNSLSPNIKNIIVDELLPGKHITLKFMPVVMASAGTLAIEELEHTVAKEGYFLVIEGALSDDEFGEVENKPVSIAVLRLVLKSTAVIALGSCATYGGIPAGNPNPTKCKSIPQFVNEKNINKPVICLPGCPPHPDWFTGTVAHVMLKGIPELDILHRPVMFYRKLIHETCERRPYFDQGKFAKTFGKEGCLFQLGCKGPFTHADCAIRSWNSGVNWCIQNGSPCIGCCEPEFPDKLAPLYEKTLWQEN